MPPQVQLVRSSVPELPGQPQRAHLDVLPPRGGYGAAPCCRRALPRGAPAIDGGQQHRLQGDDHLCTRKQNKNKTKPALSLFLAFLSFLWRDLATSLVLLLAIHHTDASDRIILNELFSFYFLLFCPKVLAGAIAAEARAGKASSLQAIGAKAVFEMLRAVSNVCLRLCVRVRL